MSTVITHDLCVDNSPERNLWSSPLSAILGVAEVHSMKIYILDNGYLLMDKNILLKAQYGSTVFFGHDPENFPKYRHAPAFYE